MNGFNTLGWWGKNRVLPNVGSLNRGGDIILSLSLYGFHHGAVANSPDIDEIVCDYYDHVGVLWTLDIHLDSGIRGKFLSLP